MKRTSFIEARFDSIMIGLIIILVILIIFQQKIITRNQQQIVEAQEMIEGEGGDITNQLKFYLLQNIQPPKSNKKFWNSLNKLIADLKYLNSEENTRFVIRGQTGNYNFAEQVGPIRDYHKESYISLTNDKFKERTNDFFTSSEKMDEVLSRMILVNQEGKKFMNQQSVKVENLGKFITGQDIDVGEGILSLSEEDRKKFSEDMGKATAETKKHQQYLDFLINEMARSSDMNKLTSLNDQRETAKIDFEKASKEIQNVINRMLIKYDFEKMVLEEVNRLTVDKKYNKDTLARFKKIIETRVLAENQNNTNPLIREFIIATQIEKEITPGFGQPMITPVIGPRLTPSIKPRLPIEPKRIKPRFRLR